jgi:flagellar hook-associated protein 2
VGVVHWQVVHDRKILQENKKQDRKTGRRISMVNSINRYLGLASGLDTESIVSGMMVAHRIPVDKLEQEKQKLEWQQEDYRSLNKSLYEFRDQVFDMKLESTFNSRLATSSNENAAVVKAGSNALEGSYMITVNQLASGVSKASASALAASKNSNGKTLTLFDQFSSLSDRGFTENDTIKVKINGTELSFDLGQDNIYTMVEKINQSDLGVRAVYDSGSNRFFLNTTATGVNSQIVITEDDSNFFSNGEFNSILKLNIDQDVVYQGQNASIDIGDAKNIESENNSITINGLSLDLKSQGNTLITVSNNADSIVDSIKQFIQSYNKIIDTLYSKTTEKINRDYAPLTKAQKDEMSEDQIEKWEEKARSGLLRNDSSLQNLINKMRSSISGIVPGLNGISNSLSSIGITNGSYGTNGKLILDKSGEDKLRKAITENPESVKKLFTDAENGISVKLYNSVNEGIQYLSDKAGASFSTSSVDDSFIGKRLKEVKKDISRWEKRIQDIENKYYSQFTMLENMMSKMNSQASWLTQFQ